MPDVNKSHPFLKVQLERDVQRGVLLANEANVITFGHAILPDHGISMRFGREEPKAGTSAAPAFSLLRLSALARCGGALVVIAGLWAVVGWALA